MQSTSPGPSTPRRGHSPTPPLPTDDQEEEDEDKMVMVHERDTLLSVPRNRDLPDEERMYYTDSDDEPDEEDIVSGAAKVEAAQAVWGPKSRWILFTCIGLSAYIYSLDSSTTYQYLYYATSTVLKHSLSGTISTAQAIIIAVGKPLMAKLSDVVGRAETFIIVTILYVIGYVVIAFADSIEQIALGEIFYAFGYTGLQILQQIVIADMTTLRYRGLVTGLVSAPFIINNFVAAEILERVLPNWRWGYLMFAILVPISLTPLILALLWAQHKARRLMVSKAYRQHPHKHWSKSLYDACAEMDFIGLFLVAASLALILLPLGLAPTAKNGWRTPSMPAMMLLGALLFPVFIWYEWKMPRKPVMPMRWLQRGPILGACLIGFCDFVSFFLQGTYLYSYIYVIKSDWNYRQITYFSALQMLALTVFGIIGGLIMAATKRFKYMLFIGLLVRLLGVTLMLHARSPTGTTVALVACQIVQGMGGGLASIAIQVSAQAAVPHVDVATVTAMVLLLTEVGNSVGSALAAGVWATYMPLELRKHVPTANETLLDELFGSIMDITLYPENDPIRLGAVAAYQAVMYKLVLGAVIVAVLPPIFCLLFTRNIKLTRAQNAIDNKDLAGRDTGEVSDPFAYDGRSVRLHVGQSPARPRTDVAGWEFDRSLGRKPSTLGRGGLWKVREWEEGMDESSRLS